MAAYGDACRYLLESKDIRKIELRISPLDSKVKYLTFFKRWDTLRRALRREYGRSIFPQVRYAVHFQRTKRATKDKTGVSSYVKTLIELDRQSAALRSALASTDKRHRRWMSALARIDVAGQERDAPASLFGIYLRLLRGEPDAFSYLDSLDETNFHSRGLECWIRLRRRGEHRPSVGSARLGLTVHAGEDFADVLDGLYQVASAIEF